MLSGAAGGLATLVSINGASNITLSGLTFANTATGNTATGNTAVSIANANNETITGNHFLNNGAAIWLSNSSHDTISGNEIDSAVPNGIEVFDNSNYNLMGSNLINGVAATDTSGGGVYLHGANNNTIPHNVVKNTGGVGIGILNWDNVTINLGNTVSFNDIMNTGTASPYDAGAIYLLGRAQIDTGTVVNNNRIFKAGASHSVAVYMDGYESGVSGQCHDVTEYRGIGGAGAEFVGFLRYRVEPREFQQSVLGYRRGGVSK